MTTFFSTNYNNFYISNKRTKMTLYELIHNILDIAKTKPNINYVNEGDIYELNNLPNINYGVFYVTQDRHQINENTARYTLNLFYVDRLLDDASNRLIIQSNGIEAITNIVNHLILKEDVDVAYPLNFTPFYQRFADECSGVFATITFIVDAPIGICSYE